MNQENLNKLVTNALTLEIETAKESGMVGYMAWVFVQATMPHKKISGNEFIRKNGSFNLSILSPSKIGLPYGSIPRLLMAWLTREAVLTKSREISLGDSLSAFMKQLGLIPTGGRWGTITRLREQSKRLFSSSISCFYEDEYYAGERGFRVSDSYDLWWSPKNSKEPSLGSIVRLSESFYQSIITNPVPMDMRVLKSLTRSPLAIDIYSWITYRMSYLKRNTPISWNVLQLQFGSGYSQTFQGKRDFKKAFVRELKKISVFYSEANFEIEQDCLMLKPSKSHIVKLFRK
jgi:hypothetical protein